MSNPTMEGYRRVLEMLRALPRGSDITEQALRDAMTVELGIVKDDKLDRHRQIMVRLGLLVPIQVGIGIMDRHYQIGEKGIELMHPEELRPAKAAKKPRKRCMPPLPIERDDSEAAEHTAGGHT